VPKLSGVRIHRGGELDTAVTVVVEHGRIARIYAIRNPHKPERLDEVEELSR
jgi:RNA polymerase sigma-70 factor, ECF subfamily